MWVVHVGVYLSSCIQLASRFVSIWGLFHLGCNRTLYQFLLHLNTMIRCARIREKKCHGDCCYICSCHCMAILVLAQLYCQDKFFYLYLLIIKPTISTCQMTCIRWMKNCRVVGMGSKLIGCGSAIPTLNVSNANLSKIVETSDEWIAVQTGIRNRRVLSGNYVSDLF